MPEGPGQIISRCVLVNLCTLFRSGVIVHTLVVVFATQHIVTLFAAYGSVSGNN